MHQDRIRRERENYIFNHHLRYYDILLLVDRIFDA